MYSQRLFQLLFVALGLTSIAQATVKYDESGLMIPRDDKAAPGLLDDVLPDETPGISTPSASGTSSADPTSSTATDDEPTSTSEVPSSTTTKEKTTERPKPTQTPSSEASSQTTAEDFTTTTSKHKPKPTSTEKDDDKPSKTTEEPVVSTSIEVVTKTNSDGSHQVMTTSHITTSTPETQKDDGKDNGSGLTPNTRNIVIGVVVGVGGAILLGALGLVAWRIRSRKKAAEESEGLMEYSSGYATIDKTEPPNSATGTAPSSASRSPFQTTLDTYHQPNQVNTASNF